MDCFITIGSPQNRLDGVGFGAGLPLEEVLVKPTTTLDTAPRSFPSSVKVFEAVARSVMLMLLIPV